MSPVARPASLEERGVEDLRRSRRVLVYGVHESGYREVIALDVGEAETEAFWRSFLCSLVERGLSGVQLIVSDAEAARCSVHFLRRPLLGADRRDQASELVGDARRLPAPLPKLAALLEEAGACAFFCVSVSG